MQSKPPVETPDAPRALSLAKRATRLALTQLALIGVACFPPPSNVDPILPTPEDEPSFETIAGLSLDFLGRPSSGEPDSGDRGPADPLTWSELHFERFFPPNPRPQGAVWQVELLDQRRDPANDLPLLHWRSIYTTTSNRDIVTETTVGVADLLPLALHSVLEIRGLADDVMWHQEITHEIVESKGQLFPLAEGQALELEEKFLHRVVDHDKDRDRKRKRSYRFQVLSRYDSYVESEPHVPGPIFVIEKIEKTGGGEQRTLVHYSTALAYSILVRHEYPDDSPEEKRLVAWR